MRHSTRLMLFQAIIGMAVGSLALACPTSAAGEQSGPIDLSAFGEVGSILDAPAGRRAEGSPPILPVVHGLEAPATQFYVSGIVGASFATIDTGGRHSFAGSTLTQSGADNETIFTGGGALGMALARPAGLLRMEVEGRARGPMSGSTDLLVDGIKATAMDVQATNGWSSMVNFWRDYFLTDSLGIYAGGGFGVGGYHYALQASPAAAFLPLTGSSPVTTFAWQIGTGFVYEISDRVTLDTGYRFFAMTPESTAIYVNDSIGLGSYSSAFSASELLLSVRIYEPFRSWR